MKHLASKTQTCLGHLPGDVNSDRTAAPVDILSLIDDLNRVGVPPLAPWQCDIDHSDLCAPADILKEVDLLNQWLWPGCGGDWGDRTLSICPSMYP